MKRRILAVLLALSFAACNLAPAWAEDGTPADSVEFTSCDTLEGWSKTGGNPMLFSANGYHSSGAVGCNINYGAFRSAVYQRPQTVDLSPYLTVEWDVMFHTDGQPGMWDEIVQYYAEELYMKLGDAGGGTRIWKLDAITYAAASDDGRWVHFTVSLDRYTSQSESFDLSQVKTFAFSTVDGQVNQNVRNGHIRFDNILAANLRPDTTVEAERNQTVGVFLRKQGLAPGTPVWRDGVALNTWDYVGTGCTVGGSARVQAMVRGDVNGDGICSEADVKAIKRHVLGTQRLEGVYWEAGNMKGGQTELTIQDAVLMEQLIAAASQVPVTKAQVPKDILGKNQNGIRSRLHGLNFIDDTTPVTVPAAVPQGQQPARTAGRPYVVDLQYDVGDMCVAIYNAAADFAADATGLSDASAAIQSALNAAKEKGGGTVYLPQGVYLCNTPLTVPSGVTLWGEWRNPEEYAVGSAGTVLLVKAGRGQPDAAAFCTLSPGAGLRSVTILYPDQRPGAMAAYPPTIGQGTAGANDSYTLMNVTIAGAWTGYQGSIGWSELHYLKEVYITALSHAVMLDNVTDIGRLEGVHLAPDYLRDNQYRPFTDEEKQSLEDYMLQYSVGLWMKRSDWEYIYDFSVSGHNRGIQLLKNSEGRAVNAQFMKLHLDGCKIAMDITATNGIGCAFTDINITGDENAYAGVLMGPEFVYTTQFENLHISGPIQKQFAMEGAGRVTLVNCTFEGWADAAAYAVSVAAGGMSLQQCTFANNRKHVSVSDNSGGVSILGCTFGGTADIAYNAGRSAYITIDNTPLNLAEKSGRQHVYRQSIPKSSSEYLYDVTNYGAQANKDCTNAFRAALTAARATGGIVYVPAGEYVISAPLTVPSGVELRGVYAVPTHSCTAGSIIRTVYGKNQEDAQALINLEAGSGINGMSVYYPDQMYEAPFTPYAWTVRSLGRNCWAVNTVFVNSYNALDFGSNPSDGHYINYVSGAPLRRGVFVGSNSGNGWVENVQFNPHYWKRAKLLYPFDQSKLTDFNNQINETLVAFYLGDNASEHMLNNFAFGSKSLLVLQSQGAGGTNGTIIGHGSDGCRNAVVVQDADVVEFINSQLVCMNSAQSKYHILMEQSVTGTAAFFNTMMWAQPDASILSYSGTLILNQVQYYNMEQTQYLVNVQGGQVYLGTALLIPKPVQINVNGTGYVELEACLIKPADASTPPGSTAATYRISSADAFFSQRRGWWV